MMMGLPLSAGMGVSVGISGVRWRVWSWCMTIGMSVRSALPGGGHWLHLRWLQRWLTGDQLVLSKLAIQRARLSKALHEVVV